MLNEALRLIRVYHDMKQGELASKLEISRSYMSEIESGAKSPSVELIEKYSALFGIPASSILFFSENINKSQSSGTAYAARTLVSSKIIKLLKYIEDRTNAAHVK
jgi:transcriptional regulator with XRE-family HTH domain